MIKNMTIDIDKQYCKIHRYNAFYVDKIHSYAHNDSGAFFRITHIPKEAWTANGTTAECATEPMAEQSKEKAFGIERGPSMWKNLAADGIREAVLSGCCCFQL